MEDGGWRRPGGRAAQEVLEAGLRVVTAVCLAAGANLMLGLHVCVDVCKDLNLSPVPAPG